MSCLNFAIKHVKMVKNKQLDVLSEALSLPKGLLNDLHSARVKVWGEIFEVNTISSYFHLILKASNS